MKRMLLFLLVFAPFFSNAQNLLRNGALEDPTAFALDPSVNTSGYYFSNWYSIGASNPKYVYDTHNPSIKPIDGLGVVRFQAYKEGATTLSQHLVGELKEPMHKDSSYMIEFHIALNRSATHAANSFELYFSETKEGESLSKEIFVIQDRKPITNMRWRKVQFKYVPVGGERHFHIKMNGSPDVASLDKLGIDRYDHEINPLEGAYYYVDGIKIQTGEPIVRPEESTKSLAMVFDLRASHANHSHNLNTLKEYMAQLKKVTNISVFTLNDYPQMHYRGEADKFDVTAFQELLNRSPFEGSGSNDEALQEAYNSIAEFGVENHVVLISETGIITSTSLLDKSKLHVWQLSESIVEEKMEEVVYKNVEFITYREATKDEKLNQYSIVIGAEKISSEIIRHLRAEASRIVHSSQDGELITLSTYNYGNIIRDGTSAKDIDPIFFSNQLTEETIDNRVALPMAQTLEHKYGYRNSDYSNYHPDSMQHVIIGISDTIIDFDRPGYSPPEDDIMSEFKRQKDVPIFLSVFNSELETFDYYQLDRDTKDWKPCTKANMFPAFRESDYHSYHYQSYINDTLDTSKNE